MINIKEVAKRAGVSQATVSRVINNTAIVDAQKKKRVENVIKETGFKPNQIARSLYKQSSRLIGFILPDITNPFFSELARAVEDRAFELGYKLILCNSDSKEDKQLEYINMLIGMNADGLIITSSSSNTYTSLNNFKLPFVALDRLMDNEGSSIVVDNFGGGVLATEHLIDSGCKNIIHMRGPIEYSSAKARCLGYEQVMKKHSMDIRYIDCEYNSKGKFNILDKYSDVDGIFACNDFVATTVYKELISQGKKIPEDIQIIGFDNIYMTEIIGITTISQPINKIGHMAVDMLLNNKKEKQVLDVKIKKRQSTI